MICIGTQQLKLGDERWAPPKKGSGPYFRKNSHEVLVIFQRRTKKILISNKALRFLSISQLSSFWWSMPNSNPFLTFFLKWLRYILSKKKGLEFYKFLIISLPPLCLLFLSSSVYSGANFLLVVTPALKPLFFYFIFIL